MLAHNDAASEENEKMWLALLLAWVAGFADAFGFITLKDVFFSAVSGNTVAVNANLTKRNWSEVVHHGFPIIFFVSGVLLGAIIEKLACRWDIRRRFSIGLAIEAILLLGFALVGQSYGPSVGDHQGTLQFYLLVALLSGAMGIQTVSLRRVRQESVNTPFVTGMLVRSLEAGVDALFNAYDRARKRQLQFSNDSWSHAVFYGALWLCFAVGAICGGLGEIHWKYRAIFAPTGVLFLVILCDLIRPIHD